MKAIQACAPNVDALGVDVNAAAVEEARQAGFEVHCTDALGIMGLYEPGSIDLVATCGMLIHVAPDDLPSVMKAITTVSGRFVLCVEYMSETEEEVLYRGHSGRLWRRPFGKLYQQLGLTLLSEGEAGGFDNCQYALLEKRQP